MTPVDNDIDGRTNPRDFLDSKRMDIEAGYLGRLFGTGRNAARAMIWTIVVLEIAVASLVSAFAAQPTASAEFLKTSLPVVTLAIGYLAGASGKSSSD